MIEGSFMRWLQDLHLHSHPDIINAEMSGSMSHCAFRGSSLQGTMTAMPRSTDAIQVRA